MDLSCASTSAGTWLSVAPPFDLAVVLRFAGSRFWLLPADVVRVHVGWHVRAGRACGRASCPRCPLRIVERDCSLGLCAYDPAHDEVYFDNTITGGWPSAPSRLAWLAATVRMLAARAESVARPGGETYRTDVWSAASDDGPQLVLRLFPDGRAVLLETGVDGLFCRLGLPCPNAAFLLADVLDLAL